MAWSKNEGPLGLLACTGDLPLLMAEAAAKDGRKVIVIGVKDLTNPAIERHTIAAHYLELGVFDEIPRILKHHGVREVAMAGGLPKRKIYDPTLRLDGSSRAIFSSVKERGDDKLLRAFEIFLRVKAGVRVLDCRTVLKKSIATKGPMTKTTPTPDEREDLKFGMKIARGVGKLDIGQSVVVKKGVVLAVEALEGTDETLRRGGALARQGAVVVKTAKPNQDLRFDLPCVGPRTIEVMAESGCRVLGVEAGKTLLIRKEEFIQAAERNDIVVMGI